MDNIESDQFNCEVCGEDDQLKERVECSHCKAKFHKECVMINDNMSTWNCDRCKTLSIPQAPRSHRSKSVRSHATSALSQQLALQKLEEEKQLLQRSMDEKFRLEKEFLDKKYELLQEGSRGSASIISSTEKVQNWIEKTNCASDPADTGPHLHSTTIVGVTSVNNVNSNTTITGPTTPIPNNNYKANTNLVSSTMTTNVYSAPITSASSGSTNVEVYSNPSAPNESSHNTKDISIANQANSSQVQKNYVTFSNKEYSTSNIDAISKQLNTSQHRSTTISHDISMGAMAARQVVPKELPKFGGNPSEWLEFISAYEFTTEVCEISEYENAGRLQKSLSGVAFESVRHTLYLPNGASNAISTLRRLFGQPEFVISELLDDIRKSEKPRSDNVESIIKFSLKIDNVCASMKKGSLDQHLNNPLLLQELISYLPTTFLYEWAQYKFQLTVCNIEVFATWLKQKTDALLCVLPKAPLQNKCSKEHLNIHMETGVSDSNCKLCESTCVSVASCPRFKEAVLSKKWEFVKSFNLCRTCLKSHKGTCWTKERCGIDGCQFGHHKLLHKHSNVQQDGNVNINFHKELGRKTLYKIVPIKLSHNGRHISTYAILDDCSSTTLLEKSISDMLGISGQVYPLQLKWTGEVTKVDPSSQLVCVEISGMSSDKKFKLDRVRTVSNLNLPKQSQNKIELESYQHLKGVPFPLFSDAEPRMLIGLCHAKLLSSTKLRIGKNNEPIAAKTPLGWVVYGGVESTLQHVLHISEISSNDVLDGAVRNYFSLESLGIERIIKSDIILSAEETRAKKIMQDVTKFKGSYYETGLLWKYNEVNVPKSYQMAMHRFSLLEKKLSKDQKLKKNVDEQMLDYLKKGYSRILSKEEIHAHENNCWYLPIFIVCNPNKPDKVRLVWDAAAKVNNVSLNSLLLKGPDMLASLPGILRRFRERKIAFTGDIREMFHQVHIKLDDQRFQRFIWRFPEDKQPSILSMNVMTFGATCSPACANYVLNLNASRFENVHPDAVKSIQRSHYVDDLLECTNTTDEAIYLAKTIEMIHEKGGFEIRNWSSNDTKFLKAMNSTSCNDSLSMSMDPQSDSNVEKILGLWWDTKTDSFMFLLKFNKAKSILNNSSVPSKRDVLRALMSIFDPLGLLSHILAFPRILLQDIWRRGFSWDEPISDSLFQQWQQWISCLPLIEKLRIPRHLGLNDDSVVELHTFVDASEEAFACAVYVRACDDGMVNCKLVAAKSKVAPLKPLSMPRLELQAALIGARMAATVKEEQNFRISREFYWSDSATVLSWLRSDARRYRQFVAVRIGEILENTQASDWRWIPTKLNVADLATRKLIQSMEYTSTWFSGPNFLYEPEHSWPENRYIINEKKELRAQFVTENVHAHFACSVNIDDRSDWRRIRRSQAYVIRFIHNCKSKAGIIQDNMRCGPLLRCEYNTAQNILFARCQEEGFVEEMAGLKHDPPINVQKSSTIFKDSPYLDCNGVLRSNSRLSYAKDIPLNVVKPVILPKKHRITELLIDYYHRMFHHVNCETAVNEIRQSFIIPSLRVAMKSHFHKCQYCKNKRAKINVPFMSNLPEARLGSYTRAFTYVGIDFFGPIKVRVKRSSEKRWGVIITCLTVRAIHIEVAASLSTDSCMMCIQRFICRRGMPLEIYSDNGKNLRGASEELKKAIQSINQVALAEKFNNETLQWNFNPPSAPHMGGAWERLIRSIKITLNEILPTRTPTDETLNTMMHEVENIINCRPLTYVPLSSDIEEAITPNHFLLGSSNGKKLMGSDDNDGRILKYNWKQCEEFSNRIWKKWRTVYLPELRRRFTFNEHYPNLEVGDVVILCDNDSPKNHWPKAIVIATFPSKDGIVRKVTIKTDKGNYTRPVSRLARLDIKSDDSTTIDSIEVPGDTVTEAIRPPKGAIQ